jgi:hypothetical protein
VSIEELKKLQAYFRKLFANETIDVRARPQKDDSAEVYIGGEFIGVLFRDDEDGDLSYNFTMAILDFDLED